MLIIKLLWFWLRSNEIKLLNSDIKFKILFKFMNQIFQFLWTYLIIMINIIIVLISLIQAISCIHYEPISDEITLKGRYYIQDKYVAYDWTCFSIEICFEASKIVWLVEDFWNIYQLIIDDSPTKIIKPNKDKSITIFQSKIIEHHCLKLVKIT